MKSPYLYLEGTGAKPLEDKMKITHYGRSISVKRALTDIAILVPDISSYKPVIESVFTRVPQSITYNLVDVHAQVESHFAKAALGLFELAAGRFSRKEVFELLLNPCVAHKWKISSEDVTVFAQWAEQLHIFHSFDKKDKKQKGYADNDLHTWK